MRLRPRQWRKLRLGGGSAPRVPRVLFNGVLGARKENLWTGKYDLLTVNGVNYIQYQVTLVSGLSVGQYDHFLYELFTITKTLGPFVARLVGTMSFQTVNDISISDNVSQMLNMDVGPAPTNFPVWWRTHTINFKYSITGPNPYIVLKITMALQSGYWEIKFHSPSVVLPYISYGSVNVIYNPAPDSSMIVYF